MIAKTQNCMLTTTKFVHRPEFHLESTSRLTHPPTTFHALHMLRYNLVFCNSFLDGHFPLSQRNNLVTERSRNFLQSLASGFSVWLVSVRVTDKAISEKYTYGK